MVRFRVDVALGGQLKAARERLGWSVTKLSQLSGVASSSLYEWERGAYLPSLGPLLQVLSALNLTLWVEEGNHDQAG